MTADFPKLIRKKQGLPGYTLIYNSYGLILAAHDPFESTEAAIEKGSDIHSETIVVKRVEKRKLVGDTDVGMTLKENIADLEKLLEAYRTGARQSGFGKNNKWKRGQDHGTDDSGICTPRRLELLRQVGIEPVVEPSHVQEVITSTDTGRGSYGAVPAKGGGYCRAAQRGAGDRAGSRYGGGS